MSFFHSRGWHCQFLEEDLKTPLPRKLHFANPDKIVEMSERVGALTNPESRQSLEHGIAMDRGGLFMTLTAEQYVKLLRR